MSALQPRYTVSTGVVSELALARAQRNTVVIVDDLFSSRLLIAEIVRQIDGKPRARVRAEQPRRYGAHRLQASGVRRDRARQADPGTSALCRYPGRRYH